MSAIVSVVLVPLFLNLNTHCVTSHTNNLSGRAPRNRRKNKLSGTGELPRAQARRVHWGGRCSEKEELNTYSFPARYQNEYILSPRSVRPEEDDGDECLTEDDEEEEDDGDECLTEDDEEEEEEEVSEIEQQNLEDFIVEPDKEMTREDRAQFHEYLVSLPEWYHLKFKN